MKEKTIFQHEEGEKPLLRTAETFKRVKIAVDNPR